MLDGSLRVLILEDNPNDAELIETELRDGGIDFTSRCVSNEADFLDGLRTFAPHVVLADYTLPGFDGLKALGLLQKEGVRIPFILISGAIVEEVAVSAMRMGASDYLLKDRLSRLGSAVNRALETQRLWEKQCAVTDALNESLKQWHATLNGISDAIALIGLDRRIQRCNRAMCTLLRKPLAETLGRRCCDMLCPDRNDLSTCPFEKMTKSHCRESAEVFLHDRWYRITVDPIWAGQGRLGGAVHIISDITEQKKSEEAIRVAEAKYRGIFENTLEGLFQTTRDGKLVTVNAAGARILGYASPEEIIAARVDLAQDIYARAEDAAKVKEGLAHAGGILGFEFQARRKDGKVIWLRMNLRLITDAPQRSECCEGSFEDITDRKRSEEEVRRLLLLQQTITRVNEALVRMRSEERLCGAICEALTRVPYADFVWISLQAEQDGESVALTCAGACAARMRDKDPLNCCLPTAIAPVATALHSARTVVVNDLHDNGHTWPAALLEAGCRSLVVLPLLSSEGCAGVLGVCSAEPNRFGQMELGFLSEVSNDIGIGIRSIRLEKEVKRSLAKMRDTLKETVEAVSTLCEMRDPYTAGHDRRVASLSCEIGREMGLPEDRIDGLRVAALLHDIGKIAVPAEILSKPGRMTELELGIIRLHARTGHLILEKIDFPWPVAEAVLQHHERMNGTGYDQQLSGDQIILEARILAVADVVEAMASHRPYRPALGIPAALQELEAHKGELYDPAVVDVCLSVFNKHGFKFD